MKELKNTNRISEMYSNTDQPIFVTENGYGDLMAMSIKTNEEKLTKPELYEQLAISEKQFENGEVYEAKKALSDLRKKYSL